MRPMSTSSQLLHLDLLRFQASTPKNGLSELPSLDLTCSGRRGSGAQRGAPPLLGVPSLRGVQLPDLCPVTPAQGLPDISVAVVDTAGDELELNGNVCRSLLSGASGHIAPCQVILVWRGARSEVCGDDGEESPAVAVAGKLLDKEAGVACAH